jgi:fucose 4-O-acetylase-like acetyltransferase
MKFFNTPFILSDKRHGWIDFDRGISIILVTYRHCFEGILNSGIDLSNHPWLGYINVFFFGFRMPLFFIASGIFISGSIAKRGLNPYINNRVKTILYPMAVWGFIQIALQLVFAPYTNAQGVVGWHSFYELFTNPRSTGQFWYLHALFLVGIVYALLKVFLGINYKTQLAIGVVFYCLCAIDNANAYSYTIELSFINDFLKYYLFFAIGDAISNWMMEEKTAKLFSSYKFILPLIIAFITIQYFFTEVNLKNGNNYHVENHMPLFFLLVALVGCTLSLAVSFSLKKKKSFQFLRVIGYHSVSIYCMQIIVMSVSRQFLQKILGIDNPNVLLLLVLTTGILIPMIIYQICIRINMWWLFSLKKPTDELKSIERQVEIKA